MFARNEKYGKALHLPYGFEAMEANKKSTAEKTTFFMKLMSYFLPASEVQSIVDVNHQLELDLDRGFLNQAVTNELRNHDSAANQNDGLATEEKIA